MKVRKNKLLDLKKLKLKAYEYNNTPNSLFTHYLLFVILFMQFVSMKCYWQATSMFCFVSFYAFLMFLLPKEGE